MKTNQGSAATPAHGEALYSPVPGGSVSDVRMAKRPASLKGLKVGFLGNLKSNCDILLEATEAQLMDLGAGGSMYREKESASLGASAELLDELAANCQVAVVGLGN